METWNVFRKLPYIRMQTSTVHAVHPSLRGTFLYWMQSVTFLRKKKNLVSRLCFRPIFPPSTQQIILLEQYLLIYLSKKTVLYIYRIKVFTEPVFEVYREPVLTKPWRLKNGLVLYHDPSLRFGEFQFWTGDFGWFLARWPENPDFPSESGFTHEWLCLALFGPSSVGRTLKNIILCLKNRKVRFHFHS